MSITCNALIVAGGTGQRVGGAVPKQYQNLNGTPLIAQTIQVFLAHPRIQTVRVVIGAEHGEFYHKATENLDSPKLLPPVEGGQERQESVRLGLESLQEIQPDWVLIHDAARPFLSSFLIDQLLDTLTTQEGAILAVPVTDTVKKAKGRFIETTLDRGALWRAQTPQAFHYPVIHELHERFKNSALTDDAALLEAVSKPVFLVEGEARNIKITNPEDFNQTQEEGKKAAMNYDVRVGHGIDVHAITFEKKGVVILGVPLDTPFGLEGHSDADVGLHAVVDALLGAIGKGDIGQHFPPHDPQWKDADSSQFLEHACHLVRQVQGRISHVDVTIMGEKPKISPHREIMRERLATLLSLDLCRVSVKATTTEKLGFLGRSEGLAAFATATVIFS